MGGYGGRGWGVQKLKKLSFLFLEVFVIFRGSCSEVVPGGSWLASWGPSWRVLGRSWGRFGASWGALGPSWRVLGWFWGGLGAVLERLGTSLGRVGAFLAVLGSVLGVLGQFSSSWGLSWRV